MDNQETQLQKTENEFWGVEEKQFTVLMHIAQFAGFVVPLAGYALPIIMWFQFKDQNSAVDTHGKNIINWMICSWIYGVVFALLSFILVGIPLLFALGVCCIVFPILGAIKANDGIIWKYPGTIEFLK